MGAPTELQSYEDVVRATEVRERQERRTPPASETPGTSYSSETPEIRFRDPE
jgi:hypothetical protein